MSLFLFYCLEVEGKPPGSICLSARLNLGLLNEPKIVSALKSIAAPPIDAAFAAASIAAADLVDANIALGAAVLWSDSCLSIKNPDQGGKAPALVLGRGANRDES